MLGVRAALLQWDGCGRGVGAAHCFPQLWRPHRSFCSQTPLPRRLVGRFLPQQRLQAVHEPMYHHPFLPERIPVRILNLKICFSRFSGLGKKFLKPTRSETKTGTKFVRFFLPRLHLQLPSQSAHSFSYSFRRGFRRGFRSGFRTGVRPGSNSGFRFEVYKKNPFRCSGGLAR